MAMSETTTRESSTALATPVAEVADTNRLSGRAGWPQPARPARCSRDRHQRHL